MEGKQTGLTGHLIVVNGPIIKELGIASGTGAAGGEYAVNASIGYFVKLIEDIVGGSKPPDGDKTPLGWAGDFVATVIGEREDELPPGWLSFAREHGFKSTDNVVTLRLATNCAINMNDHCSVKSEGVLTTWANTMNGAGFNNRCMPTAPEMVTVIVNPEAANLLAKDGWTKEKIRKFLWENARTPLGKLPICPGQTWESISFICHMGCLEPEAFPKDIFPEPVTLDTLIPLVSKPEQIEVIVSGGRAKHSQYWAGGVSCMVKIEK